MERAYKYYFIISISLILQRRRLILHTFVHRRLDIKQRGNYHPYFCFFRYVIDEKLIWFYSVI